MSKAHSRTREIGTALAVLAVYLLTLLAPMHHARASQLAFEQVGYSTLSLGWALCTSDISGGESERQVLPAKCPAAGIGKTGFVAPLLGTLTVEPAQLLHSFGMMREIIPEPKPASPPSGSRAPPALL